MPLKKKFFEYAVDRRHFTKHCTVRMLLSFGCLLTLYGSTMQCIRVLCGDFWIFTPSTSLEAHNHSNT